MSEIGIADMTTYCVLVLFWVDQAHPRNVARSTHAFHHHFCCVWEQFDHDHAYEKAAISARRTAWSCVPIASLVTAANVRNRGALDQLEFGQLAKVFSSVAALLFLEHRPSVTKTISSSRCSLHGV